MMHGYPGVAGVGTGDTPVVQARQTPAGYLGGVPNGTAPTVTLQQKQYASALYEGIVGTQPGDPPCPKFVDLLVTAPDDTRQARRLSSVPAGSVCGLEIHPVVAGTNGGANIPPPDDKH